MEPMANRPVRVLKHKKEGTFFMEAFWFWLLILLLVFAVLALPTWPYTRDRGLYRRRGMWPYGPSAAGFGAALLVLLLFWLGFIVIAWPWYAAGV